MLDKGKAPLTAQQIARAERANRRRADREKSQQVITVSTNPAFNLTPSPGPIRVDKGIVSLELVKHPNAPENFQGQWNLENLDRGFANIPKKKGIVKRVIPEKLKLFLTFSPRFKDILKVFVLNQILQEVPVLLHTKLIRILGKLTQALQMNLLIIVIHL